MGLTNKRRVFVNEYLRCWNATKAARLADYAHPGSQGHRLLKIVEIQEEIARRLKELKMSADEVLIRLADQARADISEFIKPGGAIDWEKVVEKGCLVHKIKHDAGKHSSIELYNSQSALALLGKAHGLFVERQEISGPDGGPVVVVNWDGPSND